MLTSIILDTIWLGGWRHCLLDTNDAFAHAISLSAVAIHSALSEHIRGIYEPVDFSPTNMEPVYNRILTLLLAHPSLPFLRERLARRGDSLIGIGTTV